MKGQFIMQYITASLKTKGIKEKKKQKKKSTEKQGGMVEGW